MQTYLLYLQGIVIIIMVLAIVTYAPFVRSLKKACWVVFGVTCLWASMNEVLDLLFPSDSPPAIGLLVAPFLAVLVALIFRGIKTVLFKIPVLAKLEKRMRREQ